jgi:UDP-N-acetylmuramyl pentapeptide phosphotransferase/UDP-N-acetylglucosamine-1-phosphate transferase
MSLAYIFSTNYLFDSTPPTESRLTLPLMILFGALILLAALVKVNKKLDNKIKKKQFYAYLITGILGWTYLFGRVEALPWLGSRFYLALIVLMLFIWITYIVIWMIVNTPKQKKAKNTEEIYRKYLPNGHR